VLADDTLLANFGPVDLTQLMAVTAAADELAAHESLLDAIEKETKAPPVWRAAIATPAAPS
jgi:hypothetical protein